MNNKLNSRYVSRNGKIYTLIMYDKDHVQARIDHHTYSTFRTHVWDQATKPIPEVGSKWLHAHDNSIVTVDCVDGVGRVFYNKDQRGTYMHANDFHRDYELIGPPTHIIEDGRLVTWVSGIKYTDGVNVFNRAQTAVAIPKIGEIYHYKESVIRITLVDVEADRFEYMVDNRGPFLMTLKAYYGRRLKGVIKEAGYVICTPHGDVDFNSPPIKALEKTIGHTKYIHRDGQIITLTEKKGNTVVYETGGKYFNIPLESWEKIVRPIGREFKWRDNYVKILRFECGRAILEDREGNETPIALDTLFEDPYAAYREALAAGKRIQWRKISDNEWQDAHGPLKFDSDPARYRVHPDDVDYSYNGNVVRVLKRHDDINCLIYASGDRKMMTTCELFDKWATPC